RPSSSRAHSRGLCPSGRSSPHCAQCRNVVILLSSISGLPPGCAGHGTAGLSSAAACRGRVAVPVSSLPPLRFLRRDAPAVRHVARTRVARAPTSCAALAVIVPVVFAGLPLGSRRTGARVYASTRVYACFGGFSLIRAGRKKPLCYA